ncbi:MAG: MTH1187 family thiamine-binding protein [Cytophagales bacterium]|nr:MTH1187 family thiamine-binding protein [Cytophagales bacterium]
MNFSIFPVDKGAHIGEYVSKVIEYIKSSGMEYQLTSMGTIIEAPTVSEVLQVVEKAYDILDPVSDRVYCVMNMDYKKNELELMSRKVKAIEDRIGEVNT